MDNFLKSIKGIIVTASMAAAGSALAGTFVYVSNAEDGD